MINRGHEFEKEQEWVYGRVWREETEERNIVIIISKQKKSKSCNFPQ